MKKTLLIICITQFFCFCTPSNTSKDSSNGAKILFEEKLKYLNELSSEQLNDRNQDIYKNLRTVVNKLQEKEANVYSIIKESCSLNKRSKKQIIDFYEKTDKQVDYIFLVYVLNLYESATQLNFFCFDRVVPVPVIDSNNQLKLFLDARSSSVFPNILINEGDTLATKTEVKINYPITLDLNNIEHANHYYFTKEIKEDFKIMGYYMLPFGNGGKDTLLPIKKRDIIYQK